MLCRTMLGKLPLVSTSFANLTTDESLEAVPIATDYEKFFPIHYFYFPIIRQVLRIRGPKVLCNGPAKERDRARMRFTARRSAVFGTSFRRSRRTRFEGRVSFPRDVYACSLQELGVSARVRRHERPRALALWRCRPFAREQTLTEDLASSCNRPATLRSDALLPSLLSARIFPACVPTYSNSLHRQQTADYCV